MRESDILHEDGRYWIARAKYGFDVYRTGVTHSTRCAIIGFKGDEGMRRALAEIARRKALDAATPSRTLD